MKSMLKLLFVFLILVPIVLAANVDLDKLDAVKFSISEGDEKTLKFNDVEYKLKADSVSENEVKLTFLPVNYAASVTKENKADIDIDDDNEIDFSLTFVSSAGKTASLEAKRIGAKKIKTEAKSESDKSKSLPDITVLSNALRQNFKYVLGAGALLVVIILIVVVSRRKGNPEKLYRKAEDLHREAQEFHDDGDSETAAELYEKAEEFREKARGLEKGGI